LSLVDESATRSGQAALQQANCCSQAEPLEAEPASSS
jgi:hypothetical protein